MTNTGVLYSIHGRSYWPRLVVSLMTLRRHYQGAVCIMALDDAGYDIAKRLADDPATRPIDVMRPHIFINCRNGGYAAKPKLPQLSPYTSGVFLDADTVVAGKFFASLLPKGNEQVVLTQFSNWHTLGKRIDGRVTKWQHVAAEEVHECKLQSWPAVNTGVYGFVRDSEFFQTAWPTMTLKNSGTFICDEIAAQLLVPRFVREGKMSILPDWYNCSPVHGANKEKAVIWHYHGDKHMRPGLPMDTWWPEYLAARQNNIAGICDWAVDIDPRLAV